MSREQQRHTGRDASLGHQPMSDGVALSDAVGITFSEFIQSTTSTVVMRDEQLTKRDRQARAQLRSVPFFKSFGLDTIVHADVWDNEFKLTEYNHIVSDDAMDMVNDLEFPLVHTVTQEGIDEYGEEDLVRALLNRSVDEDGQYILVTDTTAPCTPTYTKKPGRSIVADFDVTVKDYSDLSSRFLDEFLDSALPAAKTRNLYYHHVSDCHKRYEAPATTLEDIFDYTRAPTESPVWEPLYYLVEHDLENILDEYSERIRDALRSWTERGETQRIANKMLDALRVCDFEREQLETYQYTTPDLR